MTKKAKVVQKKEQLIVDDLIVGETIPDLHDQNIEITDDLIEQMKKFETENKSHAIWRDKITGSFLFWKMNKDKPPKKKKPGKKPKKVEEEIEIEEYDEELEFDEEEEMEQAIEEVIEESLEEAIEEQVVSEEELLLDAKGDYASEFNIKGGAKNVNTKTKKFKAFFEKFKESE